MTKPKEFIILKYEAAYEIDSHVVEAIKDTLEQLRSMGAGRATDYLIVSQEKYDDWYNDRVNFLHEIEIPFPQVITID